MTLTADLSGATALVTGASSGLGAHFARTLARSGAEVIVAARRLSALEGLVAEITATGAKARALPLDVRDFASIQAAVTAAGPIDILVNNAGVSDTKPLLDRGPEDFDFIVDTNLRGTHLVALETAKTMQARGQGGSIINIASILGLRQGGQVTPYAVAKAGLIQLTKQFALELARYDIRVNAIAPGYVATELNQDFFATDAGQALIKRVPQRRLAHLEDLDGALLLLASSASRYMTGAVLAVDGGHLLSGL